MTPGEVSRAASRRRILVLAATLAVATTGGLLAPAAVAETPGVGVQVGTYDSLTSPDYRGILPVREASKGLTLGLGTFDDLDGELVLLAGTSYRVGTDGTPVPVTDGRTTPFFEGVRFRPTASGPVAPGTPCADLGPVVTALAGRSIGMVAVRVRGTFTDLVTRSVPRQTEPYPPLSAVVAQHTTFPLGSRRAVLVGFLTGAGLQGVGAPGLHLHGLTVDRLAGGHVLSCVAGGDVQVSVQPLAAMLVRSAPN